MTVRIFVKIILLASLSCSIKADDNLGPLVVVNNLHDALLVIMRQGNNKTDIEKRSYLHPIVSHTFDFPKIAHLVTGQFWKKASEKERKDFEKSLLGLATTSYVSNFNTFSGHHFKLIKKTVHNDKAIIETSLIDSAGEAVKIRYMLRKKDNNWLIVNVIAKGVSDLSLKRADYIHFLKSNSLGALAKTLNDRAKLKF